MGKEHIQLLLVKYICDDASDDEIARAKEWISLHPENELYFIELYEAWHCALAINEADIDEELAYKSFKKKIIDKEKTSPVKWYKLTALLIFPFSLAAFIFLTATHPVSRLFGVTVKNGSIKKIALPDGTVIWINSGSAINYDLNFGKTNRTVFLTGEALFDVGHKLTAFPFIVKTKTFTVKDVGTSFDLKAYPNDFYLETTVLRGEISVEDNAADINHNINRIFIKARQVLKIYYKPALKQPALTAPLIKLRPDFDEVRLLDIDSSKINVYDGWKDNLLVFDGTTLGDIAKVLERKYDVNIDIKTPELRIIKYTGNFNNVPSITRVLEIIKQNTPLDYAIAGNKITITKNN